MQYILKLSQMDLYFYFDIFILLTLSVKIVVLFDTFLSIWNRIGHNSGYGKIRYYITSTYKVSNSVEADSNVGDKHLVICGTTG